MVFKLTGYVILNTCHDESCSAKHVVIEPADIECTLVTFDNVKVITL